MTRTRATRPMRLRRMWLPGICFLLAPGDGRSEDEVWLSAAGRFRVSYTSELEPIEINRIHGWIIHVETAEGEPVEQAELAVEGGMPAHDHGLPTHPRMTGYLGDGDYRVEGLRFHMGGDWEVTITIAVDGNRDTCVIPLRL